jgi:hypothetical protein
MGLEPGEIVVDVALLPIQDDGEDDEAGEVGTPPEE